MNEDPGPFIFNVQAQGELDRPLYETTVNLSGCTQAVGFREAIAFAQARLSGAGYAAVTVKRWIVTVLEAPVGFT